jgi:hypothetical protein
MSSLSYLPINEYFPVLRKFRLWAIALHKRHAFKDSWVNVFALPPLFIAGKRASSTEIETACRMSETGHTGKRTKCSPFAIPNRKLQQPPKRLLLQLVMQASFGILFVCLLPGLERGKGLALFGGIVFSNGSIVGADPGEKLGARDSTDTVDGNLEAVKGSIVEDDSNVELLHLM